MTMAMKPMHRLIHQLQRPDGGVEWACPQCGVGGGGQAGSAWTLSRLVSSSYSRLR